ncbi:protoheme IX farnesyltransferase [Thermogymnomonas acidicola]|uniref:Protoheme IX farnesyltransferase n=1 Tax=Thermogymnomonas acidicola TaxID=399579 RepID=A0AA37FC42_9ARCH|nr:heme o synthase [Thermogymnomonas acidicola]GGM78050.1 protoheme IX farnesyltransferase [Thermogymnomonas acidicola]
MKAREFLGIFKVEITVLIDIVAVSAFLSVPGSTLRLALLAPLLVSGSLASFSSALFNNIYDQDIDGRMKRTEYRTKLINWKTRNLYIAVATLMIALSMAISQIYLNTLTSLFIFGGFLSYFVLYTVILKRRTIWNIVIGGIAGSFPALAGWSSLTGSVSSTSLFLAFLVFLWTPSHFWSLASSRVEDYIQADVPMLPVVKGVKASTRWIFTNTVVLVAYTLIPFFVHMDLGRAYFPIAIASDVAFLYLTGRLLVSSDTPSLKRAFHFSNLYLLLILVSVWLVAVGW